MVDASKEVSSKGLAELTSSAEVQTTTVEITPTVQKAMTPSSTEITPTTAPVKTKIEVRSGTSCVRNPSFTNLLRQVTSIKLDIGNFHLWHNIILHILKSYKLEGHLTSKTPAP